MSKIRTSLPFSCLAADPIPKENYQVQLSHSISTKYLSPTLSNKKMATAQTQPLPQTLVS